MVVGLPGKDGKPEGMWGFNQCYKDQPIAILLLSSLLAVLGYALLCGEVNVPVRSEHVTTVPGDTLVVGDSVEVMSA